jgi:hypothetical protein
MLFGTLRKTFKSCHWAAVGYNGASYGIQGCQMVYFQTKKPLFGYIFGGLGIDIVGTVCGHSVYFTTIWYVSWPFGTFCGHSLNFLPFWYVAHIKLWQPCWQGQRRALCCKGLCSRTFLAQFMFEF